MAKICNCRADVRIPGTVSASQDALAQFQQACCEAVGCTRKSFCESSAVLSQGPCTKASKLVCGVQRFLSSTTCWHCGSKTDGPHY